MYLSRAVIAASCNNYSSVNSMSRFAVGKTLRHGCSSNKRSLSSAPSEWPTNKQLRIVAMRAAIPMVGFGFIDNVTMITAGEAIDASFGVAFGLSTMAAAGFGQCVSDVAGLTGGGIVDASVAKMNLPHHGLSQAQMNGKRARIWGTVGGCIGVLCGCLLGMSCLLFMDTERAERAKKAKELNSIFQSVMEEGHKTVHAERATLWFVDGDELWSRVATGTDDIIHVNKTSGVVGACVKTGKIINIADAYEDDRFNREVDKTTGYRTQSILACPVKDADGNVLGAIQMINKKRDGKPTAFERCDEKMVQMLASHVAGFKRIVEAV